MSTTIKSTKDVLETFSDPNLVSHGYLDTALERYNPLTQQAELHSATSQLLSQLDHASQELTWKLEETMTDLLKSGPRLNYEVELLRSGVAGLVSDIDEVSEKRVEPTESSKASEAMRRLEQLERVRSKMQEVEAVLREAEILFSDEQAATNEVITLIDNKDVEGALKKVERLAELVQVWKGTSQYSAKVKFVAGLRKRIEEALSNITSQQQRGNEGAQLNRSGTPSSARSSPAPEQESYYGLLGQLRGKIGY